MESIEARLGRVIRQLEQAWLPPPPPIDLERYSWESLPLEQFLPGLLEAAVVKPGRFLDVGCGIGTKMLVAREFGYSVSGIEIYPEYAARARGMLPEAEIIEGDVEGFDRYGEYDFLYCYRPFKNDEREDALEDQIIGQMKTGAWLFLPHRNWLPGTERSGLHWMGTPLWRKAW